MKASLQLAIGQQLTLTPQLQQAIRLLQLSTQDLHQEIQQALENNPMLEVTGNNNEITIARKDNVVIAEDGSQPPESSFHNHYSSEGPRATAANSDYNHEHYLGSEFTLQAYLSWQLQLTPMTELDRAIATAIIEATNDDGFLTQSPQLLLETVQHSESDNPIQLEDIEVVRRRIMRFDPLGVAAKDLQECLLVQLQHMDASQPLLAKAIRIVSKDIHLLGQHNYKQILKNHQVNQQELAAILEIIRSLDPKPGRQIEAKEAEYVIPDVVMHKQDDQWIVSLNQEALPKLRINGSYASMIKGVKDQRDSSYLKNNLQEAKWFLKSIQSRQETLLKVAKAIVEMQQDFFESGEEYMKPLVLNDIAEMLEMHESTISRVTTQKFMHTPRGTFELKYFFSSHLPTQTGGECSSTAIRAVIKKLIAQENQEKPLSDQKITAILAKQGIKVARRTIAKYREAMGIPPSNERKSLAVKD